MRMSALTLWEIAAHLIDAAIAYALALPIGWDARASGSKPRGFVPFRLWQLEAAALC
jgi:hypothetical protein